MQTVQHLATVVLVISLRMMKQVNAKHLSFLRSQIRDVQLMLLTALTKRKKPVHREHLSKMMW
jgi:hypothetical protein